MTELCDIAFEYGTDKCPQVFHNYTPFYYELLKDRRQSIKKVLELGIGTPETMYWYKGYKVGASLFMWRDFFPNAKIFGADILPEAMIKGDRIKTFLCDERKKEDLELLIQKTGSDIDLFIDDGLHRKEDQIFVALTLLPLLKKDVIYIIEDVGFPYHVKQALKEYRCKVPKLEGSRIYKNRLLVVQNI